MNWLSRNLLRRPGGQKHRPARRPGAAAVRPGVEQLEGRYAPAAIMTVPVTAVPPPPVVTSAVSKPVATATPAVQVTVPATPAPAIVPAKTATAVSPSVTTMKTATPAIATVPSVSPASKPVAIPRTSPNNAVSPSGQVFLGGNVGVMLPDPLASQSGPGTAEGGAAVEPPNLSSGYVPVLAVDPGQYMDGVDDLKQAVEGVAAAAAAGAAAGAGAGYFIGAASPVPGGAAAGAAAVGVIGGWAGFWFGVGAFVVEPLVHHPQQNGGGTQMPNPEADGYPTPSIVFPSVTLPDGTVLTPPQPGSSTGVPVVAVTSSPSGAPGGFNPWINPGAEPFVPISLLSGSVSPGTLPPGSLDPWINPGFQSLPNPDDPGSGGQPTDTGGGSMPIIVFRPLSANQVMSVTPTVPRQGPNIDPSPEP